MKWTTGTSVRAGAMMFFFSGRKGEQKKEIIF
jgi:hypothetical protein